MNGENDFTNAQINKFRMYGGANGNKIGIFYHGENYMLKFPPKPSGNVKISYTNSCISEYVACHVFETLGMDVQQTLLGRYDNKITVACKDFEEHGFILRDFAQLKNTVIDSTQNGYGTELSDVLEAIHNQQIISPVELENFFWELFIGDVLLGNFDRHNGNWGLLTNERTGDVKIAPVYDCGSCLYPQIDENGMQMVLNSKEKMEERLFVFPNSALKQDGVKINYAQFLMKTDIDGCLRALKAIGSKIDLSKIDAVIESTPYISNIHKTFLKTMIKERKEQIIDRALERVRGVFFNADRNRDTEGQKAKSEQKETGFMQGNVASRIQTYQKQAENGKRNKSPHICGGTHEER